MAYIADFTVMTETYFWLMPCNCMYLPGALVLTHQITDLKICVYVTQIVDTSFIIR